MVVVDRQTFQSNEKGFDRGAGAFGYGLIQIGAVAAIEHVIADLFDAKGISGPEHPLARRRWDRGGSNDRSCADLDSALVGRRNGEGSVIGSRRRTPSRAPRAKAQERLRAGTCKSPHFDLAARAARLSKCSWILYWDQRWKIVEAQRNELSRVFALFVDAIPASRLICEGQGERPAVGPISALAACRT